MSAAFCARATLGKMSETASARIPIRPMRSVRCIASLPMMIACNDKRVRDLNALPLAEHENWIEIDSGISPVRRSDKVGEPHATVHKGLHVAWRRAAIAIQEP